MQRTWGKNSQLEDYHWKVKKSNSWALEIDGSTCNGEKWRWIINKKSIKGNWLIEGQNWWVKSKIWIMWEREWFWGEVKG